MKSTIFPFLILVSSFCCGQIRDSTIVILAPFEVTIDPKLSTDVQSHVGESHKLLERLLGGAITEKTDGRSQTIISRLKMYETDFDFKSAWSFFYTVYLHSKLEHKFDLIPLHTSSSGDPVDLKKIGEASNARWVINVSSMDFYIDATDEYSSNQNRNKGRVKIQLFDLTNGTFTLTQELVGETSGIEWFLPCESGEFKCILNYVVLESTFEFAEYFLR